MVARSPVKNKAHGQKRVKDTHNPKAMVTRLIAVARTQRRVKLQEDGASNKIAEEKTPESACE